MLVLHALITIGGPGDYMLNQNDDDSTRWAPKQLLMNSWHRNKISRCFHDALVLAAITAPSIDPGVDTMCILAEDAHRLQDAARRSQGSSREAFGPCSARKDANLGINQKHHLQEHFKEAAAYGGREHDTVEHEKGHSLFARAHGLHTAKRRQSLSREAMGRHRAYVALRLLKEEQARFDYAVGAGTSEPPHLEQLYGWGLGEQQGGGGREQAADGRTGASAARLQLDSSGHLRTPAGQQQSACWVDGADLHSIRQVQQTFFRGKALVIRDRLLVKSECGKVTQIYMCRRGTGRGGACVKEAWYDHFTGLAGPGLDHTTLLQLRAVVCTVADLDVVYVVVCPYTEHLERDTIPAMPLVRRRRFSTTLVAGRGLVPNHVLLQCPNTSLLQPAFVVPDTFYPARFSWHVAPWRDWKAFDPATPYRAWDPPPPPVQVAVAVAGAAGTVTGAAATT